MAEARDEQIEAVRRFSRLYLRRIAILVQGLRNGPFSQAQLSVLYDLMHAGPRTAQGLCDSLGFDPGYVSRILGRFEADGLVARRPDRRDGRRRLVSLTDRGRAALAPYDQVIADDVRRSLSRLDETELAHVITAMRTLERLLGGMPAASTSCVLRPPHPGDYGWVVHRLALAGAGAGGDDAALEAALAACVSDFIRAFDPRTERCWIAECGGRPVGSAFVIHKDERVAHLQLLYVEPETRRLGVGKRLMDESIAAARATGHRRLELRTWDTSEAGRAVYAAAGFERIGREPYGNRGRELIGEIWQLVL